MPGTIQIPPPSPITTLTDDEVSLPRQLRQFADEKIRPLVKEMDEKGVFDKELLHEFFQLGLMGIEIPEQYNGGGGRFSKPSSRLKNSPASTHPPESLSMFKTLS